MAIVTQVSIGTSNRVSVHYQSQEVHVSVTYALESQDADLLAFMSEKAAEVERAHAAVWKRIRDQRAQRQVAQQAEAKTMAHPKVPVEPERPKAPEAAEPFRSPESAAMTPNDGAPMRRRRRSASANEEASPSPPERSETNVESTEAVTPVPTEAATAAQQRAILSLVGRARMTETAFEVILVERFGKRWVEQLTKSEAAQLLMEMQRGAGRRPSFLPLVEREKAAA
jgi:hypothetical protein